MPRPKVGYSMRSPRKVKTKVNKQLARDVARAKKAGENYGDYKASQYALRQAAEFALHKAEFEEQRNKQKKRKRLNIWKEAKNA